MSQYGAVGGGGGGGGGGGEEEQLVDNIVLEVKSKGLFDKFRKECHADVDTKPAYQNLQQRVVGSVTTFLGHQKWKPDLNKNQLREKMRKHIIEANYLEQGLERIVDQVVNPKVAPVFIPQVEDVFYNYIGVQRPRTSSNSRINHSNLIQVNTESILPTDLEAVSPDSVKSQESQKDEKIEIIVSQNKSYKMDVDPPKSENIEDLDSPPYETIEKDKSESQDTISGISDLTSHDSNDGLKVMTKAESKLEDNADTHLSRVSSLSNISMDIPLPDDPPKSEINQEECVQNELKVSTDAESSSDSTMLRNVSPLTPVRNYNNENSSDAQPAFDNENKIDQKNVFDIPIPISTFRFTIESKTSSDSNDLPQKENFENVDKSLPTDFKNQVSLNNYSGPSYDDSSNSNNLHIDYQSDHNNDATVDKKTDQSTKTLTAMVNLQEPSKSRDKSYDEKRSSHKSSRSSRDSHRHSSSSRSKDRRSDSKHSTSAKKDSHKSDKKNSRDDGKSRHSSNRERSKDRTEKREKEKTGSSKDRHSNSHKSSSSHKDSKSSKHTSSSSHRHSSSKHSDDKKSSSHRSDEKKVEKERSNFKSTSRDHSSHGSSHRSDKDRKSSSDKDRKEKDKLDKEKKDDKNDKKVTDDHYSASGRGHRTRRSTDRDSNDENSSSSKASTLVATAKANVAAGDNKSSSSKSENHSSGSDSTGQSDAVEQTISETKNESFVADKLKPVIQLESQLKTPIIEIPKKPEELKSDKVSMKKPMIANNMVEVIKLKKLRKHLAHVEQQKRQEKEKAAMLLAGEKNIHSSVSQVFSDICGPEFEFACNNSAINGAEELKLNQIKNVNIDKKTKEASVSNTITLEITSDDSCEDYGKSGVRNKTVEKKYENDQSEEVENKNKKKVKSESVKKAKSKSPTNASVKLEEKRSSDEMHFEDYSHLVQDNSELAYFGQQEIFNAELEKAQLSKVMESIENIEQSKLYLLNCEAYVQDLFQKICKETGDQVVSIYTDKPKTYKTVNKLTNKDLEISSELNLSSDVKLTDEKIKEDNRTSNDSILNDDSNISVNSASDLSVDYERKLDEMVQKTSKQEIMEIILGGIEPGKIPQIEFSKTPVKAENTPNLKRRRESDATATHSPENNNKILKPNKIRKFSLTEQITSTTEGELSSDVETPTSKSKLMGRARRVGLTKVKNSPVCIPKSPSSDKSVENYVQNIQASQKLNGLAKDMTPNATNVRTSRMYKKQQRYESSDLYKPKLHYLSRRSNHNVS